MLPAMYTNLQTLLRCSLGLAVLLGCEQFARGERSSLRPAAPRLNVQTNPIPRDGTVPASFAPIVKKVAPSVVTIYSTKTVRVDPRSNPLLSDPFFRRFFGGEEDDNGSSRGSGRRRQRQEQGLGSGVIISTDGYILSNNHVVEEADEVTVGLVEGGPRMTAKVVGTDPQTDISVLKVQGTNLPALTITDSSNLEVGDLVLALGNPFGVGQTVTMGIVSAVGRGGFGIVDYEDFIQTDASINPGNSGGPLVDAQGRLVGINTAILSGAGGNIGIGFSVPINMARGIMERIIESGRVVRGFLGVTIQPVTPELAKEFKLPTQSGALVGGVSPGSPAARAGIQAGDVVTEFNGRKVTDSRNLRLMVAQMAPDSKATVRLLRDGKERNMNITLGELPTEQLAASDNDMPRGGSSRRKTEGLAGIEVAELDSQFRQQFDIPPDVRGAVVMSVDTESQAYEAGLRPGAVILEINRQKVSTPREVTDAIRKAKGGRLLMRMWTPGGGRFIVIEPEKPRELEKE
jgi:serine protease Do